MATRLFFESAAHFRRWLEQHHDRESELIVGFYKKTSGTPSITYPEAVDQALCFGWIDGIRKMVDAARYTVRFTPRRASSNWSAVNRRRFAELDALGLVHASGMSAFANRKAPAPNRYSYENRPRQFEGALAKRFRANKEAWAFFTSQPPGYQRTGVWYVLSAARDETRLKRLDVLIAASAKHRRLR